MFSVKKTGRLFSLILVAALFIVALVSSSYADEGMWTYDNLPVKTLKQKYNFEPTQQWLDYVRLSSVRFSDGGSGSFISPTGLVLTNHHVASEQLQKVSTPQVDYLKNGFYAKTQQEEIKCPDLELNVLVSMENITSKVESAIKGLSEKDAIKARKKLIAQIEKQSQEKTGLKAQVVPLYHGGEYWLYSYKKYRDVRIVFAPEAQIAFFGGDPDNFTYPRYCIDMAIFRAYENGKPVNSTNYLKLNPNGAKEGELVFVSGHPGTTHRLFTLSQLLFLRDVEYPFNIDTYKRRIKAFEAYGSKGTEQKRQVADDIFSFKNYLKADIGEHAGLIDNRVISKFQKDEENLKSLVKKDKALAKEVIGAWADIDKALASYKKKFYKYSLYNLRATLPLMAQEMVLFVQETKKPDSERLDGYHDSEIDTWKFEMLSPAPIFKGMEKMRFINVARQMIDYLGKDDKFVKIVLGGKSPEKRADELFDGTKLDDSAYRKALVEGGEKALKESKDPLIKLALKVAPIRREMLKWKEANYDSVITSASEKIAKARFKIYGKSAYPDATFTLRLAYGTVNGYPYNGTYAPYKTTFYGLYDRYFSFDGKRDWNLPKRYIEGMNKLDLSKPLDFVCTNDIIGGNSGSPVVNTKGELVGLIFDGNMESLPGDYVFIEEVNRAVAVHPAAMVEALEKLYGAGDLLKEIMTGK